MSGDPDPQSLTDQLVIINMATAVAASLQTMVTASTTNSLAYLTAVRQSAAAGTLELATLATAVNQVLTPPRPRKVRSSETTVRVTEPPPGYPVVT